MDAISPPAALSPKLLNPNGYICVIRFPKQKTSTPPSTVEQRKEIWKARKWMEKFAANSQLELTKREKFHLFSDVCRDTLWVICCPPCSATGLTNKLAFSAPRKPAYWPMIPLNKSGTPQLPVPVSTFDWTNGVKIFWITTKRGNRIACSYTEFSTSSAPVILYNHSNADDLGTIARHLRKIAKITHCNVFAYDYSGYGLSEGNSTLRNFYADADAAWKSLRFFYGFNSDEIILYGSSLGSVAAAYLAAKYGCKGCVMVASISSGIRLLCRGSMPMGKRKKFPFDVLDNITLAKKIRCPVLVVHGEEDQLCPIDGAEFLVRELLFPAEPAFYRDVGHNEVDLLRLSVLRINNFIHTETREIWREINQKSSEIKTLKYISFLQWRFFYIKFKFYYYQY